MKTTLVAAVAMLVSLSAYTYAEGLDAQIDVSMKLCKVMGQQGQVYYQAARQGKRIVMPDTSLDWLNEMRRHIENDVYVNYQKYDEEETFLREAAYCLTNVNRLAKAARENDEGQK
jgi:hypothetical protein